MFTENDLSGLHTFLKTTPETHLKKMLVGGDFTEMHFKVILKLARGCNESEFVEAAQTDGFAKLRLNGHEIAIKETFWSICFKKFTAMGLIAYQKMAA